MDARELVDYAASLDCVHCGLCVNACPTYRLTPREPSSPRGRIHLMRALAEGTLEPDADYAEELDYCLLCRRCESVCPSGVRFGAMMEHARDRVEPLRRRPLGQRLARFVGLRVVLRDRGLLALAGLAARAAERSGLARLLGLPRLSSAGARVLLPTLIPPQGGRLGALALLEGCVMPELLGATNRATAVLLARAGYEVRCAPAHVCCGSLHAHNGDLATARALARETIELYERLVDDDGAPLTLVVNSAGCGAHLKEYGALLAGDAAWSERARSLAARTRDLSEILCQPAALAALRARVRKEELAGLAPLAWDDPCHLCHGQGIRREPRALLDLVGLPRVELADPEACCGSAGLYALARPADSRAVLAPRLEALARSGARALVTSNPGCQLQWESGVRERGLDVRVLHLAEALELATRG
jgi:glycolate oxidase iron-sulfur subunit